MDRVQKLKAHFCESLNVLECDTVNGSEVVTFGVEEEPYVLNFQLDDENSIRVTIIDKDKKTAIETYTDSYETEEQFDDKINEAEAAYDVILASKPQVEQKLESKAEADRRDEVVYRFKAIRSEVKDFTDKYDHDYGEEDVSFDNDALGVASNIEMYLSDIKENCKSIVTESIEEPEELPVDQGEKKANEVSPKDTSEDEEIASALESAGELTLLQTLISKLNAIAEAEEDEINERVISDVAIQLDELLEELETIVQEWGVNYEDFRNGSYS